MKKTMTYNDAFFALTLVNDLSQLKLKTKAMTEKLLLRSHYMKPLREYEDFNKTVDADEKADDESKKKARETKAAETIEGFMPRPLSIAAFEQIVEAAAESEMIATGIATPQTDNDGKVTGPGSIPTEMWLQSLADNLVEF